MHTYTRTCTRAYIQMAEAHPAWSPRFDFPSAVREHLSFGAHLILELLRPSASALPTATGAEAAAPITASRGGAVALPACPPAQPLAGQTKTALLAGGLLESQKLLSFCWDRTSDGAGWAESEPRFFHYERYRLQNLSRRPDLAARVPADPGLILTPTIKQVTTLTLTLTPHPHPHPQLSFIIGHELSHHILDHNEQDRHLQGALSLLQLLVFVSIDPTGTCPYA